MNTSRLLRAATLGASAVALASLASVAPGLDYNDPTYGQYTAVSMWGVFPAVFGATTDGVPTATMIDTPLQLGVNTHVYLTINTNGSVSVSNTLYAKEIRVKANPFPDYVFDAGYPLLKLSEVEAAIRRDHRLPGMPSAQEIQADGLPVSGIVVKQMEKIEELTLYAIDLQKSNDRLAAENAALAQRLARIEQVLHLADGK
jgi:hypothetical protein